jgi:hypothetical protein
MPVTGTVVARNLQDGVTVLSSDIKGTHSVEWGAMGDPDGNDVQYIPEEVVNSVPFKKALARGVIELLVEDSDEKVAEALSLQVASFKRRQAGAREDIHSTLERPANNDSLMLFCVGPDSRGNNNACGQPVPMLEKKKDDVPPLCHTHRPLAAQYVAESGVSDGKSVTIWTRVTMGARESL